MGKFATASAFVSSITASVLAVKNIGTDYAFYIWWALAVFTAFLFINGMLSEIKDIILKQKATDALERKHKNVQTVD